MTSAAATISYEEWVSRLAGYFFREKYAGTHVMFYVDRPLVGVLAKAPEEDAVSALARAVCLRLRTMTLRRMFEPVGSETRRWRAKGGKGPPPCLPVLALSVVAATDMRAEQDRSSNNYYGWFYDLLRLGGAEIDPGAQQDVYDSYGDEVPPMWDALKWWLDEANEGRLGFSTITEDEHWTRLGFADSQTLFKASDRDKLTQFLTWLGISPSEELPKEHLVEHFRIWSNGRDDLSLGAWAQLQEEQFPRQLADLLQSAANSWTGVERDDSGRTLARIELTLTGPPRPELRLSSRRPQGFPEEIDLPYRDGVLRAEALSARTDGGPDDWYASFDIPVTDRLLRKGLAINAGERTFRFTPRDLYVLHRAPSLGRWATVDVIRPHEKAWLLARCGAVSQIESFLSAHAREQWKTLASSNLAPEGWALIRNVVIDPIKGASPEGLQALAPRSGNRLRLRGGLPMPRGRSVYLEGGAPDLELPPVGPDGHVPEVALDGDPVTFDGEVLRLAERGIEPGPHRVTLGEISIAFGVVAGEAPARPEVAEPISHQVEALEGTAIVSGAMVDHSSADVGSESSPIVLPVGASSRVLIGDRPGEVETVEAPERPRWMREAGLDYRVFEHSPRMPVAWVLTDGFRGLRARPIESGTRSSQAPMPDPSMVAEWAAIVADAAERLEDPHLRSVFEKMREAAQGVVRES